MQVIDGKLYPPMAGKVKDENGKYVLNNPNELGQWMQSVEDPDNAVYDEKKGKYYYNLNKGNGSSAKVETDLVLHAEHASEIKNGLMGGVTSQSEFTAENSTPSMNSVEKLLNKVNQSIFKDELSMDVLERLNGNGYTRTNSNALNVKYSKGVTLSEINNYNKAVKNNNLEEAQNIVDYVATSHLYVCKLFLDLLKRKTGCLCFAI